MSKMSQLHAELSEQASELGFESLGEAEQAGYGVDWENAKLLPPEDAAHQHLLAMKLYVMGGLEIFLGEVKDGTEYLDKKQKIQILTDALKLIKEEVK